MWLLLLLFSLLPSASVADITAPPSARLSHVVDIAVGCIDDSDAHARASAPHSVARPNRNASFRIHHAANAQSLILHFAFAQLDPSTTIKIINRIGSPTSPPHDKRQIPASVHTILTYNHTSIPVRAFYTPPIFTNDVEIRYTARIAHSSEASHKHPSQLVHSLAVYNDTKCYGFHIDAYYVEATAESNSDTSQTKATASHNDADAACTTGEATSVSVACLAFDPDVVEAARPVARLLIQKPLGAIFCTGWLLGCEGHVLTNHHCVSQESEANATTIEFMAQGATCAQPCDAISLCPGRIVAASAEIIAFSPESDLDYVLLRPRLSSAQLKAVVAEYGFLSLRASGAVLGEEIFIPQHPAGCGKRVALKYAATYGIVESLTEPSCNARSDNIVYSLDTKGGSSGAPVIASADKSVIGLHYCGGCRNSAAPASEIVQSLTDAGALPACGVTELQWPSPATHTSN